MFLELEVTWDQALVLLSSLWLFTMFSVLLKTRYCGMSVIRYLLLILFGLASPSLSLVMNEKKKKNQTMEMEIYCCHKLFRIWSSNIDLQAYPHKILTGRRDKMHTMRQTNGLSGFTKRSESEYDCFGTGHSSTTISAGLGNAQNINTFVIFSPQKKGKIQSS